MQRTEAQTPQRIAKLLARAGVASRREIERMIAEGRVALNGAVLDTPATILPSLDGVTVDGEPIEAAEAARLFLFHKPPGYLTAATDPAGRKTIYDALPADLPRLIPVGRLDLNTEGLLLLTTDGELKRQLELPATGVERSYRARAYGQVGQAQLEELIDGVEIEGVRYGKIDANLERRTGANVWIEMTLAEGKNREVRRVLEHLGLRVSRLIRTRYGPFILADLPAGAIGEVRQHDLEVFRKTLKTPAAKRVGVEPVSVDAQRVPRPARSAAPERTRVPAPAERTRAPNPRPSVAPRAPEPVTARKSRQAPHKPEVREELDTRPPRRERDAPADRAARPQRPPRTSTDTRPPRPRPRDATARADDDARPPRARRPTGWAKAKPKARPGKPRKPSR